jgi:glycoside/pentoside/hexuronide:cation symporter, GPH family
MTPIEGRIPNRLAFFHGLGSIAYGIKDNGFSTFLLLYYNQVLGMDAKLVSFALLLALVLDAFVDPVIGQLSDRTRTRWGRRLPWLYLAPIPLALAWVVMWSGSEQTTFWQLVLIAMLVRTLLSACEVPSIALVPELTRDYDERTRLMRFRFLFGWTGGLLIAFLAYSVFLVNGPLDREGYFAYGLAGAVMIACSVVISALGQHRWAAHPPPPGIGPQHGSLIAELREALAQPAFLVLLAGGALAYTSQGITFSITNYLFLFIWSFSPAAFQIYPAILFAGVTMAFLTVSPMHRRWGKRDTAAASAVISMLFWVVPFILRHFDLWPEVGSTLSTGLIYGLFLVANWLGVSAMISAVSMMADVVEAHEADTGKRAEGTFFAGQFFVQKCATGLGIFFTGLLIDWAGLPENAKPETVDPAVVDRLSISYAVIVALFAIAIALVIRRFPISRSDHEARVAALGAARVNPDAEGMHP